MSVKIEGKVFKNKKLNECLFNSYEEICEFIPNLRSQIREKITKDFLKRKLWEKRRKGIEYLNEQGFKCIERYIGGIDLIYEGLMDNLLLNRLSRINISKFSNSDKGGISQFLVFRIIEIVSLEKNMGTATSGN